MLGAALLSGVAVSEFVLPDSVLLFSEHCKNNASANTIDK
jgi:hypothetical protein